MKKIQLLTNNRIKLLTNSKSNQGYVYIITSDSYNNKLKIGRTKTRDNIGDIKKYLFRRFHTSLGQSINIYLFHSNNFIVDENKIHFHLDDYREKSTELFRINLDKAIMVCKKITQSDCI